MNSLIFRLLVKLTLYGLPLDVSEGPPLVILSGEIFRLVILSIMTTDLPLFIIVALTDVTSLLGLLFNEATAPQVLLPLALLQALAPAHFHRLLLLGVLRGSSLLRFVIFRYFLIILLGGLVIIEIFVVLLAIIFYLLLFLFLARLVLLLELPL